jgi:hypothetical protein
MTGSEATTLLERYRIPEMPEAMYYIPDFISTDEEKHITDSVSRIHISQYGHREPSRIYTLTLHRFPHPAGQPSRTVACKPFHPDFQRPTLSSPRHSQAG